MPRVSIVCGAYNACACHSFQASVESILSQTYSDLEFIICDDGSTDETYARLSEYAARDSRIRLLQNEKNLGLAATLNRCIAESSGEYIARHDCDDLASPERLEEQIAYLDAHPEAGVLGTAAKLFDEEGVFGEVSFPLIVKKKDFLFCSPMQHGSVVFRREVLLKAGCYRVAKETRRTEDYDLFMRIALISELHNLERPLYFFCEDKNTVARRKYRYRIDEVKVRWRGFRALGLLPRGIFYVIKPLIVGLIPRRLLLFLKNKLLKRRRIDDGGNKEKQ